MEDWDKALVFGVRSEGEQWVIRPSAYGLLEDQDGRIAVVRSQDGIFLPGGGIEIGETPEDAIRREALEECGLIVLVGQWATRAVQFAHSASERAHFEKRSTFMECAIEGSDRSRLEATSCSGSTWGRRVGSFPTRVTAGRSSSGKQQG
jgi:8-oxo-dGTP pyrophosphatase MutT (NUDIX family)